MIKRKLFLVLMAICGCIGQSLADKRNYEIEGGLICNLYDDDEDESIGTAEIRKFNPENIDSTVVIPETIEYNGTVYTVTEIFQLAFTECNKMKSITIPSKMETIGNGAFIECQNLSTVIIESDSLKTIGENAFQRCPKLESINIPKSVREIGAYAFDSCVALKTFDIPEGITVIREKTFNFCGIEEITIPSTVETIEVAAFADCRLKSFTLPDNVKTIGGWVFSGCTNLETFTTSNKEITTLEDGLFNYCLNLKSVKIPTTVTAINDMVFKTCESLESVSIPTSVKSLGNEVFMNCKSLPQVDIKKGLKTIGDNAFLNCESLKEIDCLNVNKLGEGAFKNCSALTTANIENVVTINDDAFSGCSSLANIDIKNVESIGENAFSECSSLASVNLANTTSIGENAFNGCSNLKSVNLGNVKEVKAGTFQDCEQLNNVDLSKVTTIRNFAFENCKSLESADLSNATIIEWYAFAQDTSLKSVTLSPDLREIGSAAFAGCFNLKDIELPSNLRQICAKAFEGSGLTSITIPSSVRICDRWAFRDCKSLTDVVIESSALTNSNNYQDYWIDDYNVDAEGNETGKWDTHIGMRYGIFEGSGVMRVTFPEGIDRIGEKWFKNCESLESITIPASVETIEWNAFDGCKNLKSVNFADGHKINAIKIAAFANCTSLKSISIPWTVDRIEGWVFAGCSGLEYIDLPNGPNYDEGVLKDCSSLKYLVSKSDRSYSAWASDECFEGIDFDKCTLFVPRGSKESYAESDGWSNFKHIVEFDNEAIDATAEVAKKCEGWGDVEKIGGGWGATYVTLHATPNRGYKFEKWVDDDDEEYTDSIISFILTRNIEYTAYFSEITFDLDVELAKGSESMGTVKGAGTYKMLEVEKDPAVIEATPAYGYKFAMWNDSVKTNPRTIELVSDSSFTAVFVPDTFKIDVELAEGCEKMGEVSGAGEYAYLNKAEIEAKSNYGYDFAGWSDKATDAKRDVEVTQDSTISASFVPHKFDITASVVDSCKTMGSAAGTGKYDYLTNAELTATAEVGYHFVEWSNGEKENPLTIKVEKDSAINASFEINKYQIEVELADKEMATITGAGIYKHGETVKITVTEKYGYDFVKWSNDETDKTISFEATEDVKLTAEFKAQEFDVTLSVDEESEEMGTVKGAGTFEYKTKTEIEAIANEGFSFIGWSDGDKNAKRTITVTKDTNLVASFSDIVYVVEATVSEDSKNMGEVTGSGNYTKNNNVATLTATAKYGYKFVKWSDDNKENPRNVTLEDNFTISAIFEPVKFNISTSIADACKDMGKTEGDGEYTYSTIATVIATPNYGYEFVEWSNGAKTDTVNIKIEQDSTLTASFKAKKFNLDLIAKNGDVKGAGTYDYLTNAEISATPAVGYHFVNWSNGVKDATTSVKIESDSTITANFEINTYEVIAKANDEKMGKVAGAGTFKHGEIATLIATANYGYEFVEWSNGAKTDTLNIKVEQDSTLTAYFKARKFKLVTATFNGGAYGTGTYDYLTEVEITADPDYGYHFVKWDNGIETATAILTVESDSIITAIFERNTYEVIAKANDEKMGNISGADTYKHGETATLIATPNYGYEFVEWSNGAKTDTVNIKIEQDSTLTASFKAKKFNLDLIAKNGDAKGAGTYDYLTEAEISATPAVGYHFVNWSNGVKDATTSVKIESDSTITANFEINTYDVMAKADDEKMGKVAGAGTFKHGETATLIATPNYGYEFVEWSNGATTDTLNIYVDRDSSLTAYFKARKFKLVTATFNGGAYGTGTYDYLTEVEITADPDYGYHFVKWDNGIETATAILTVESDSIITAIFERNTYEVIAKANDEKMGKVAGADTFKYGDFATLIATPNYGYEFVEWSNGATTDTLNIYVDRDSSLTATFKAKKFNLDLIAKNGDVKGAGTYDYLTDVEISATPAVGYHFVNWSNGVKNATTSVKIESDSTITANFEINTYEVIAKANDEKMGKVAGAGTFKHGEIATLTATANYGYEFTGWNDKITDTPRKLDVTSDTSFTANFKASTFTLTLNATNGKVSGAGAFEYLTDAKISATPDEGYHFVNWSNGDTKSETSVKITKNDTITAIFAIDSFKVELVADAKAGKVAGAGTYNYGATAKISATANEGYSFVKWSDGVTTAAREIVVKADTKLTAEFAINTYKVEVVADAEMGTVSGAGAYQHGATATLTATANKDYKFVEWSDGVTDATRTITVTEDITITAVFAKATGIEVANSNNTISEPFDIYNMVGAKIKSGANFDDLNSLPKNVYIITNGTVTKKVMIK